VDWTCFGVRVPEHWTIISNRKLKSALKCTVYDHDARPSQAHGQTDGRTLGYSNSATIRSNERIER